MYQSIFAYKEPRLDWQGFSSSVSNLYFTSNQALKKNEATPINKIIQNMLTLIAKDSINIQRTGTLSPKTRLVLIRTIKSFNLVLRMFIPTDYKTNRPKAIKAIQSRFSDNTIKNIRAMISIINNILNTQKIQEEIPNAA